VAYHPPQRAVGAFILSLDHWIRATFHLSKLHAFEEHLARSRTFFSLTNVVLGRGAVLEFLALRASAAHLVVPEVAERELRLQPAGGTRPRDVSCYLEHVAVHGALELLPGVRTSDFLAHQSGFIMLRACRIVPELAGRPEPIPVVFVNAGAILALAEEGGRVGERRAESPADAAISRGRRVPA
jgi:hypothetical protein